MAEKDTSPFWVSVSVPADVADEFQHALLDIVGGDWTFELNRVFVDLFQSVQYEKDRRAKSEKD